MKPSNDPAQSKSQSAGITPAQNELIIRYERTKRNIRWLLVFFALFGITYTILTARSERLPSPAISESNLGQNMSVLGNTVVLSSIQDDKQEILFSRDGGKLFFRTGDTWKVQDTSIIIAIAQDSATILAIEKNGTLHYKPSTENKFYTHQLTLSVKDSMVTGICLVPGTDSVYVYGRFPGVIAFSWKNPAPFILLHTPSIRQTISMAMDQDKNVVCILENLGSTHRQLYFGKTVESLQPWTGEIIDFDRAPRYYDSVVTVIDSAIIPHANANQYNQTRRLPNAVRKSSKSK